jgi:hypothetical protein
MADIIPGGDGDRGALTNYMITYMYRSFGKKHCVSVIKEHMQSINLEIPTSHLCIEKAVDSTINKHKDLNKSKSRANGREKLDTFLGLPFIYPQPRNQTHTPYANLMQFCMPSIVVNSINAAQEASATTSALALEMNEATESMRRLEMENTQLSATSEILKHTTSELNQLKDTLHDTSSELVTKRKKLTVFHTNLNVKALN